MNQPLNPAQDQKSSAEIAFVNYNRLMDRLLEAFPPAKTFAGGYPPMATETRNALRDVVQAIAALRFETAERRFELECRVVALEPPKSAPAASLEGIGGISGEAATTLRIVFTGPDGSQVWMTMPAENLPVLPVIQSMTLLINDAPLVELAFRTHGRSIHTMCRDAQGVAELLEKIVTDYHRMAPTNDLNAEAAMLEIDAVIGWLRGIDEVEL